MNEITKDNFDEAINLSRKDLMNYSDEDIRDLADKLKIPIRGKKYMVHEIAEKLITANMKAENLLKDKKCRIYLRKLQHPEVEIKSKKIYNYFQKYKNNVKKLNISDLEKMFDMYDEIFFDNELKKYIKQNNYSLDFINNAESTFTTEGVCSYDSCSYTITIPLNRFKGEGTIVGGVLCKDQLECLQRAMEHEIVHLIIFMFCGDEGISDQHGVMYMNMVSGLFGHSDYRHYIF